jgi:hypothetical protein
LREPRRPPFLNKPVTEIALHSYHKNGPNPEPAGFGFPPER